MKKEISAMLASRWSTVTLILFVPLLIPAQANALPCYFCSIQLEQCYDSAEGALPACLNGCDQNHSHGTTEWLQCAEDCNDDYLADYARCDSDEEYCRTHCETRPRPPLDNCPLILDLGRHGFRFTSAQGGVLFDIDGDGHRDSIAWTEPQVEDGFLVLDRNLNGVIDSGQELFGDSTLQPPSDAPNGFLALGILDRSENGGNGDGVLSNQDGIWNSLQVWVDRNHNGLSEQNELSSLGTHRLTAIDLAYRELQRKDRYGNELHYRSRALLDDGSALDVVDVFFQGLP